jgi:endonuclease/exonuclease/phosphatase family metal-dependent hydrolase
MKTERSRDSATILRTIATRRQALRALAAGAATGVLGWQDADVARRRKQQRNRRRAKSRVTAEHDADRSATALKVMTRNLYLGASLGPVFSARSPEEFVAATTQLFAMVQATDFPARAKVLADEITTVHPHVVGLQEVELWRSQSPADFLPRPNATTIEYDFLALLLAELAERGTSYEAVATVQNADAEAPRATSTGLQDIRLTDRDVTLVRTDLPTHVFSVSNARSANFDARLSIPNEALGADIIVPRGWTAVDVTQTGRTVRVVNTHLEPLHPGIQLQQARELLAGPLESALPTVLLGDLNSAADAGGGSDTPTYAHILGAGFVDAWTARRGERPGFPWGHDEDLRNPTPNLTVRIDFVLTRGGLESAAVNVVGDKPADRTPSGLWPSDHAGVWAVLHAQEP